MDIFSACRLVAAFLVVMILPSFAQAAELSYIDAPPGLMERLTPDVRKQVFPGADRFELLVDSGPPAVAAYEGDQLVGYVFSTLDVVRAPGYSGTPFDIVAGVGVDGRVTGAVSLFQHEPMIMEDERRGKLMREFLQNTTDMSSKVTAVDGPRPEFISGASISARAFRNAIRDSARLVLQARSGWAAVTQPTLDVEGFRPVPVDELLADGSIVSRTISNANLADALELAGAANLAPEIAPKGGPDDAYINLRVGLATPATIGRNATTPNLYNRVMAEFPPGSQAILLASEGRYDFQGFRYQNKSSGFLLDRVRIIQGDYVFTFDKSHYLRARSDLGTIAGIGVLEPGSGFDPLQPWSAEVLVHAAGPNGQTATVALEALAYRLPEQYVLMPEAAPRPAWMEAWDAEWLNIAILGVMLVTLTVVLSIQSFWTRRRRLHRWIRTGFLLVTLGWLGWTAGGQLSIVHLVNYIRAPFQNMDLAFYLAEPLIVILTIYVAISLLLLGRGVFCGWLCPFGALQELLAQLARALKLPSWNPSDRLQSKLWWGKYASLVVIVVLAFLAPTAEAVAAEIEPFKTAITSIFMRGAPYVIYAVALLALGLFTERAFCRFLCPLGGALALLDRLHLLNVLKRRPECGSPCHLCEHSCPVRAIKPSGKIVMAECFQCLDCQVEYNDDRRCPPLAKARKQRERAERPALVINRVASVR